jgi:hypothetical protein
MFYMVSNYINFVSLVYFPMKFGEI